VAIANVNSPGQTVVTGALGAIEKIENEIEKAGQRFQRLNVSTAFHSALVSGSALRHLKSFLEQRNF
jgi:[acyl-carrier-protein] S-malonyltransferase